MLYSFLWYVDRRRQRRPSSWDIMHPACENLVALLSMAFGEQPIASPTGLFGATSFSSSSAFKDATQRTTPALVSLVANVVWFDNDTPVEGGGGAPAGRGLLGALCLGRNPYKYAAFSSVPSKNGGGSAGRGRRHEMFGGIPHGLSCCRLGAGASRAARGT